MRPILNIRSLLHLPHDASIMRVICRLHFHLGRAKELVGILLNPDR